MTEDPALFVVSQRRSVGCRFDQKARSLIAERRIPQQSLLGWVAGQQRNILFRDRLNKTCYRRSSRTCRPFISPFRLGPFVMLKP